MKAKLIFLLICLIALPILANDKKDIEEIKMIIQLFMDSGDKQDTTLVEESLLSEGKIFIPTAKGIRVIDQPTIIQMLKDKKIGGLKRTSKIHNIELGVNGMNAIAKVDFISEKAVFHQFIGLSKIKATEATVWRIVSVLTSIAPVQSK